MAWCIFPWVWRLRIPSHRKHVLQAFAECADEFGYTHCSIPTVAWMTSADEKTVRESVRWLVLHKLLLPTGAMVGRSGQIPEYRIPFVLIDPKAPKRPNSGQDIAVDSEQGAHNPPAWTPSPLPDSAPVDLTSTENGPRRDSVGVDIQPVPDTAPVPESPLPNSARVDIPPVPKTEPINSSPLPNVAGVNPPLPNTGGVSNSGLSVYNVSFSVDNPVDNSGMNNFRNTFDPSQIREAYPSQIREAYPSQIRTPSESIFESISESISENPTGGEQHAHNTQANVLENKISPSVPHENPSQKQQFGSRRLAALERRQQFAQQRQEATENPPPPPPPNSHGKVALAKAAARKLPTLDEYVAQVQADRKARGLQLLGKAAVRVLRHDETERRKAARQNLTLPGMESAQEPASAEIG